MGSVIDYIECPNCSYEAYNDYYYKTGEEYTMCNNCGYSYSAQIINRDKPLDELTDEDKLLKYPNILSFVAVDGNVIERLK